MSGMEQKVGQGLANTGELAIATCTCTASCAIVSLVLTFAASSVTDQTLGAELNVLAARSYTTLDRSLRPIC